jgi:flagellar motor switch/type III secretory pathway protein FliN
MMRYAQLSFPLEAELGRCEMSVGEILALAPGNVLTLDQAVGTKVNLFVGGASFCSGDMMRPGSAVALRITGFASPQTSQ